MSETLTKRNKFSVTKWKREYAKCAPAEKEQMKRDLIIETFNTIREQEKARLAEVTL